MNVDMGVDMIMHKDEDMHKHKHKHKVKSAPPRPISNLQSLSARGKPVADQTSSIRQCPPRFPHPAVEPASPGFCERALATGPDEKAADRKSSWPAFLSLQVAQQLTVDTRQNDARLQGGEKVLRHRPAGRWHLGDQHPDLLGSRMLAYPCPQLPYSV